MGAKAKKKAAPAARPSPDEVWVLEYSHRHGTDLSVYRTEERARQVVLGLMDEWKGDIDNLQKEAEVSAALLVEDFGLAMKLWFKYMEGEHFEITRHSVLE